MGIRTRIGAVLLAVAAVQLPQAAAQADHGSTASSGVLNTTAWKVCRSGLQAGVDATNRAINLIDASEVNPVGVTCSSGGQNVSVWSTPDSSPGGERAATRCSGTYTSTTNRCTSKTVFLYGGNLNQQPDPAKEWQLAACHELGHVGGLGHRPITVIASCMGIGNSPPQYTIYDSHDINSLNNTY